MRRARLLATLLLLLVVGAAAGLVLTSKPDLDDARDRVDRRWLTVRESLATRYDRLAEVADFLVAAGGAQRSVTADLRATLARWQPLAAKPRAQANAEAEAETANSLEALAARVDANFAGSGRLQASQPLQDALSAFDLAIPSPPAVRAYNRAVQRYADVRDGTLESVVAAVLGYSSQPVLRVA